MGGGFLEFEDCIFEKNAAIERGIHPAMWTGSNIAKMKTQLKSVQ